LDELTFPSVLAAKRAIAGSLGVPLAKLSLQEREAMDGIVRRTLVKAEVMAAVRAFCDGAPAPQPTQGEHDGDLAWGAGVFRVASGVPERRVL
jgi:hypothetical protein